MDSKQLVKERVDKVIAVTSPLFKVPRSRLIESVARGYGFRTFAAACTESNDSHEFDADAFHRRYAELENQRQACVVSAVLMGYTLDLQFRPLGGTNGTTVIYQVDAQAKGPRLPALVEFYLPKRIPSRFVSDVSFGEEGSEFGFLRRGLWRGQYYAVNNLQWGRASLSRSILAALY